MEGRKGKGHGRKKKGKNDGEQDMEGRRKCRETEDMKIRKKGTWKEKGKEERLGTRHGREEM